VRTWADSSFLVSLYVDDDHAEIAKAYLSKNPYPIVLTSFAKSEAQHALRMCAFRGDISEDELVRVLLTFERDQEEGFYEPARVDPEALFPKTAQLSHQYALSHGVRYLDMLHIASALLARSRRFLTFDKRQGKLAKSIGLEIKL